MTSSDANAKAQHMFSFNALINPNHNAAHTIYMTASDVHGRRVQAFKDDIFERFCTFSEERKDPNFRAIELMFKYEYESKIRELNDKYDEYRQKTIDERNYYNKLKIFIDWYNDYEA